MWQQQAFWTQKKGRTVVLPSVGCEGKSMINPKTQIFKMRILFVVSEQTTESSKSNAKKLTIENTKLGQKRFKVIQLPNTSENTRYAITYEP